MYTRNFSLIMQSASSRLIFLHCHVNCSSTLWTARSVWRSTLSHAGWIFINFHNLCAATRQQKLKPESRPSASHGHVLYISLSICPFLWQRVYLKINQKVAMPLLHRLTASSKHHAYAVWCAGQVVQY